MLTSSIMTPKRGIGRKVAVKSGFAETSIFSSLVKKSAIILIYLKRIYECRIKMHEKRFGVIGHPVKHSLSPLMHNAVFRKLGLKCRYEAFDVDVDGLERKMSEFRETLAGVNVTIPHKVSIIKYLDCLSEEA
ncbi:MAG: hypothetical protein FJY77_03170, partial [Candidatus Altiarchaeales archaeon]|nr:hypothetical protein [Candidatus Altiarchaeales archaeon]